VAHCDVYPELLCCAEPIGHIATIGSHMALSLGFKRTSQRWNNDKSRKREDDGYKDSCVEVKSRVFCLVNHNTRAKHDLASVVDVIHNSMRKERNGWRGVDRRIPSRKPL